MAKERRPALDYVVYLAVRLAVCLLQALSPAQARAVAHGLAWLAHRLDRRHCAVARDNLRHAFPGRYSDAELDRLVRGVYRHFCGVLAEIAHLPRKLHVDNWRDSMDLVRGDRTLSALTSGRPLLIVTGHFGNWEMAGYALGLLGFRTYAVARRLERWSTGRRCW
jgi:KDO2-lipid IV(A) lauroyltransferase